MTRQDKLDLKALGYKIRRKRKYYYAGDFNGAARACGISKATLSKIENGKTNPSYTTLINIGKGLFTSLREML